MSHSYSGTNTYPASTTLPDDGDPQTAASVNVFAADTLDRTTYLKTRVDTLLLPSTNATELYPLATRSVTRVIKGHPLWEPANWGFDLPAGRLTDIVGDGVSLVYPIEVPHGAMITALSVSIKPVNSHVALPATRPTIVFSTFDLATGTVTTVATVADPTAPFGSYNLVHGFGVSGLTTLVNNQLKLYRLEFTSESGANSITGLQIFGANVTFDVAQVDAGAA